MWRLESGFLEMFLAYYGQFVERTSVRKTYRDFLLEVLIAHEESVGSRISMEEVANFPTGRSSQDVEIQASSSGEQSENNNQWEFSVPSLNGRVSTVYGDIASHNREPTPVKINKVFGKAEEASLGSIKKEQGLGLSSYVVQPEYSSEAEHCSDNAASGIQHETSKPTQKSYVCDICNMSFCKRCNLQRHELRMHTSDRPFGCKFCSKSFVTAYAVREHERVHTGEKPYRCKFCNKTFTRSYYRKIHERVHTGTKPYDCRFCEKRFARTCYLTVHERAHTGMKPYSCKSCGKKFTSCSGLLNHELMHTSERPYACKVCGKCFKRAANLRVHKRTHSFPFICELCDEKFSCQSKFEKHKCDQ